MKKEKGVQKQSYIKEFSEIMSKEDEIQEFLQKTLNSCKSLVKLYWSYIQRSNKTACTLTEKGHPWEAFIKWHVYELEARDKLDFTGIIDKNDKQSENICASELDIFKNFNAFRIESYSGWSLRISNKVLSKLKNMKTDELEQIIQTILTLQMGYISDCHILDTGPILYLAGFSKTIKNNQQIVFAVVPERVPIVKYEENQVEPQIIGFKFRQYLRIIDIVLSKNDKAAKQSYEGFQNYIINDPDKWNPFVASSFLANQELASKLNQQRQLLDIRNIIDIISATRGTKYFPQLNSTFYLPKQQQKYFQFSKGRWISESELSSLSYSVDGNLKNINAEIIQKCTSQESCEWLLSMLKKLPNFQLKLTPEEELLITTAGNILCIGRSGTGKTTSAVLRLFALELLFKIRSSFFFKKDAGESLKDSRNFTSEDSESSTGLHSVIVTASPVLTNEIRRFYHSFRAKITEALRKKEQRQLQKQNLAEGKVLQEEIKVEGDKEDDNEANENQQDEYQEDDDELLDAEEVEKNLNMPHSMNDMKNEDFPAFLTIKRLVYMIDGSLSKPFFVRNAKNEIIGQDQQSEWHNEQKGVLMINNYFKMNEDEQKLRKGRVDELEQFLDNSSSEEEDFTELEVENQVVQKQVKNSQKKKQKQNDASVQEFAQEVDFEMFEKKFWPKHSHRHGRFTNCSSVWTEIFSIIKGSHKSFEYPKMAVPQVEYTGSFEKAQEQTAEQIWRDKFEIYQLYEQYELWKKQIKGFDFMDIVNHILREISSQRYFGVPIHFMLVDEVQDLTPATIKLLLKVTEQNVYFAGDTAQTIARGVGFRFCDLKKMVNMQDMEAPKVLQLTINFRSHNQILKLANSIISALEIFFPQTIDKLLKEKSGVNGLKPIVLDSSLIESLFYILMGNSQIEEGTQKKEKAEFGCDQVIIVRDQEAKKRIPSELQHALCLTVYECKGLEFEDVILYNFFADSQIGLQQWAVLHDIKVKKEKVKISTIEHKPRVQDIDELNSEIQESEELTIEDDENLRGQECEFTDKFYVEYKRLNMLKDYNALCTELKQLYVCITRPKKRLIIFDEETKNRDQILLYWKQLSAVDSITEDMIKSTLNNFETLGEEERQIMQKIAEGQPHLHTNEKEQKEQKEQRKKGWKIQGIKMFKRRYYEQAIKCFVNAEEIGLQKRAEAYFLAEKGSNLMSEKDQINNKLTDFSSQLSKSEKRTLKLQQKQVEKDSIISFEKASEIFVELGLKKQAAQCCFTAQRFEQAAIIFEEVGLYAQAGESYYLLGNYNKAARLYSEGKAVTQAVECYKKMKNWDAILSCVKQNEQEFSQEQRVQLIQKYVPLALNNLYHIVINDNFNEDSDQEQEELLIMGRANSHQEKQVNEEFKEEDEENEEDDENYEESAKEMSVKEDKLNITDESSFVEQHKNNEDEIVIIDTSTKQKNINISLQDSSFSQQSGFDIISESNNKSSKQAFENYNQIESFEHLSQFDPEDEFLKSRPASVLESIISGSYQRSSLNFENQQSELSCYSIIQSQYSGQNISGTGVQQKVLELIQLNMNLIKTKRDIYAEDLIMTKIVYYVSQFSLDVQSHLSQMRSKEALLSHGNNQAKNNVQKSEFIQIDTNTDKDEYNNYDDILDLDLDNFDEDFINVILDGLESFELYKLCIIVCNRYKLKDRIGRYLVSIAHKYSNLTLIHQKYVTLFHKDHKQVQEQVSFIAHHAMHSALELIEPEYLKIKENEMDHENSLGQYTYTALLNLGFWKKLIYLMNVHSGLSISSSFSDFQNFRQIYLGFADTSIQQEFSKELVMKKIQQNNFNFLKPLKNKIPQNEIEYLAYRTALDSIVWHYNNNPTLILDFKFPKFLKLTEIALKIQKKLSGTEQIFDLLEQVLNKLNSNSINKIEDYIIQLQIYDACQAIMILLHNAFKDQKQQSQINLLVGLEPNQYQQFLRIITIVFSIFNNKSVFKDSNDKYLSQVVYGLLSVLKIKEIISCEAVYDNYGEKVLVYFSSPIAQELSNEIEERKRKLTEEATKSVFSQNEVQFFTKRELNKLIKQQLRTAMQNDSIESQIEIIDLDATFLRAPLQLVIAKVQKKILEYVKRSSNQVVNINSIPILFQKKTDIDEVESIFEIESLAVQCLVSLSSSIQIANLQRTIEKNSYNWKHVLFDKMKDEITGSNENTQDTQLKIVCKYTKEEVFLLYNGLVTETYLQEKKIKKQNQQEKMSSLEKKVVICTKNLAFLGFILFKPLEIKIDQFQKNCILELGQEYWKLFLVTKDFKKLDKNTDFDLALYSLGLFILADSYQTFMEMVQKTLSSKYEEKQLLLLLLDAHIFSKCGDLFESCNSINKFLSLYMNNVASASKFLIVNLIEKVVVQALLTNPKQTLNFYVPYEMSRHLQFLIQNMSLDDQNSFLTKIAGTEDQKISISLQNNRFKKCEDKIKYQAQIQEIVTIINQFISKIESHDNLQHLFLALSTLIINVPEYIGKAQKKIVDSLGQLQGDNIIQEDHSLFDYDSLEVYAQEFHELEASDQNEVLSMIERKQTFFVEVQIQNQLSEKEISENIVLSLKNAEDNELIQSQLHIFAASKLQNFSKKSLKKYKYRSKKQNQLSYSDLLIIQTIDDQLKQGNKDVKLSYLSQTSQDLFQELKNVARLNKFITSVMLGTSYQNVIDYHYLLTQREKAEKEILPVIYQAFQGSLRQSDIAKDLAKDQVINVNDQENIQKDKNLEAIKRIRDLENQVDQWSINNYEPNQKDLTKNQKIMKLKWREHALKMKQKIISKGVGQKKNEQLQAKKDRIKKYGQ